MGVTRGMARKWVKRGGEGFGGIVRFVYYETGYRRLRAVGYVVKNMRALLVNLRKIDEVVTPD